MNPIRSVIAVLVGFFVFGLLWRAMMSPIAGSDPLTFLALGPARAAVFIVIQGVAGILSGYLAGRVAGSRERAHGAWLAGLYAVAMIWGFLVTPEAAQVPRWMQIATVVVVAGTMFAGAAVRGRAASVHSEPAAARPGERS